MIIIKAIRYPPGPSSLFVTTTPTASAEDKHSYSAVLQLSTAQNRMSLLNYEWLHYFDTWRKQLFSFLPWLSLYSILYHFL